MRILLIQDDERMRRSLVNRLMAQGVETVYQASDFGSALDFIPMSDGILSDDAFPFVAGEPSFEFAWMGMHDAAREQRKPFVMITDSTEMWLDASHQNIEAYMEEFATEAISHLVQALKGTCKTHHDAGHLMKQAWRAE
jgi:hypothetical protein